VRNSSLPSVLRVTRPVFLLSDFTPCAGLPGRHFLGQKVRFPRMAPALLLSLHSL
jgi:hypothetical protein